MYEAMVKEAYENILGIEKEAETLALPPAKKTTIVKTTARNFGRSYLDALKGKDVKNVAEARKAIAGALPGVDNDAIKETLKGQGAGGKQYASALAKTVGAYALPAALVSGGALAAKKLHDKKKAKAQAALEAAETQKEAAEQDYLEACAYEEAALEVLAELGYDVDAFTKEADDHEAKMSAEEMDEAAFAYLESRGYFDED